MNTMGPRNTAQEGDTGMDTTYCVKLVERYLKCLTQVKQFKGNATKY